MPAWMIPLTRRIDPEADVARLSVYTKLPGFVAVAALAPVRPGVGMATVNGVQLSRWECVTVRGVRLLFLPVGEVAREHARRYRVALEGFVTPSGRRFRRCAFWVRTEKRRERSPEHAERDAAALEAAREGLVLLKNAGDALPLAPGATLNCLGTAQHRWRISTAGSAAINPRWRPGFHRAVLEHSAFQVNGELADFYRHGRGDVPDDAVLARARALSDTVLVFIDRASGEMIDNRPIPGEYYLTEGEEAMLRTVRARFDRVIVILNTGYPIGMSWLRQIDVDAIVYAGFGGMLSSWALVELLDGRLNPSGHLPDAWAWDLDDNPVSRNYPALGAGDAHVHEDAVGVRVYYEEDVYLGYRFFDTFGVPVAFPFGHGLSYTRFELAPVGLTRSEAGVAVRVRVKNAGEVAGKCVLQLYAGLPVGRLEKPARVLADFEKTRLLAPGEAQEVALTARFEDIASFDEGRGAWVLEAGEYALSVGESLAARVPCGSFRLEERVLRTVGHVAAPVEPLARLTRANPRVDGGRSKVVPLGEQMAVRAERRAEDDLIRRFAPPSPQAPSEASAEGPAHRLCRPETRDRQSVARARGDEGKAIRKKAFRKRVKWAEVEKNPARLGAFVAGLSLFELCRLNVCAGMRLLPWQDGAAGYTPRLRRRGLPSFAASDAGAGLNLRKPGTGFPSGSVIAATFNREIARSAGRVIAEECRERHIDLLLGPGMNLHRSPLCGRWPEYFSEDPLLSGEMAGWQARGLREGGARCCYKHLFCNNAELGRLGSHSVVSEQALRELYFKSFEIAFRAQMPDAVMTSYNALNGLYPGENGALLNGLLRDEWGFDGAVMSDWGSVRTVSAVEMVKAGNGWITPGGPLWVFRIWKAARRGEIPRAALEANVAHLLKGFSGIIPHSSETDTICHGPCRPPEGSAR